MMHGEHAAGGLAQCMTATMANRQPSFACLGLRVFPGDIQITHLLDSFDRQSLSQGL